MAKGRKALAGTHEARLKIDLICNAISSCELSEDACNRVIKAVKFGLGIKEEAKEEKQTVADYEKEMVITPIKEKKATRKTSLDNKDGDEYFAPEDCKKVDY